MKLTEKIIAGLQCADGQKDRLVFDDAVQGLGLRISGKGGKNFLVQFSTATGAKRRLPLGAWGSITLEQARQAEGALLDRSQPVATPSPSGRLTRKMRSNNPMETS